MHDRGPLPKEEGDIGREYKAMREDNFPKQLAERGWGR